VPAPMMRCASRSGRAVSGAARRRLRAASIHLDIGGTADVLLAKIAVSERVVSARHRSQMITRLQAHSRCLPTDHRRPSTE
jgi:hypothetical protein